MSRLISPASDPIRPSTLPDEAFRALRQDILAGRLPPGSRLLEIELAERLGVSRNPVRAALARLEQLGLVQSTPNQGARVVQPTPAQVQDALLVRAQLELLAVRLIFQCETRPDLSSLERLVADMRWLAVHPGELLALAYGQMNLLDLEFHQCLIAAAASEALQRTWAAAAPLDVILAHGISVILSHDSGRARLIGDGEKHERLLLALHGADPVAAEAELKAHFSPPAEAGFVVLDSASLAILGW